MINVTVIEGFVTKKIWQYDGHTFCRLAVYRDQDLPRKGNGREAPDYVTLCIPAALIAPVADQFRQGARVQVHGWLESSEYQQSLAAFLEKAGAAGARVKGVDAAKVGISRVSTQVVAQRIVIVPDGERKQ
jgi:hypothetical protein